MSIQRVRKPLFVALALLLSLTALGFAHRPAAPAAGDNVFTLEAPPFLAVANAEEAAPMAFPVDEAGISAYFHSATPINLADVRSVFRVIEVETPDYIIGSVEVANYAEEFDVHVYVHRTGWFMAYYLRSDPAAKMVDMLRSNGSHIETLFEGTLSVVAVAAGVPMPQVTFYDFRYPNATHMMLIYENYDDGNNFTVQLPSTFVYNERSWTLINLAGGWYFTIDGQGQSAMADTNPIYNFITSVQLLPDTTHTITVNDNGVLALIYRVP